MLAKECGMLRATNWMTSLTIGLALACEASSLYAAGQPKQDAPTPARPTAAAESPRPVDYVVELPAEEADSDEYSNDDPVAPQPLEDDPAAEATTGEADAKSADAEDADDDKAELIKE